MVGENIGTVVLPSKAQRDMGDIFGGLGDGKTWLDV
eukprot:COSAG02_NODE_12272_length_1571_cov_1.173913_2_plen_35_part_01